MGQHSHKWKNACRQLISLQVRLGLRSPPSAYRCQGFCCEEPGDVYHHPDYDQPELVFPLCHTCHAMFHKYNRERD